MLDKSDIKELLYWYEFNNSGLRKINGGDVTITNIRINKKQNKIIANVELIKNDMGDGHYSKEKFRDCEYPLNLFKPT